MKINNRNKITLLLSYRLDEVFRHIFKSEGFDVLWSHDYDEMVDLIKNNDFDFAIEWQRSPDDDSVLAAVKKYRPHVPVLLTLNYSGKLPGNYETLGYADHIDAPFNLKEISRKLYNCLDGPRQEILKTLPIWEKE